MPEQFIDKLKEFSMREESVESVIIVGSYARGTYKESSDIDVCMITTKKDEMVENPDFVHFFGKVWRVQTEYYGACTSIRAWYENGLEVEFGLVDVSWLDVPLDSGTREVLRGGYKVIADKRQYFQNLEL